MTPVSILLATYNGAAHVSEQLDSYVAQDYGDWLLRVGDDGSTDDTRDILASFSNAHPGRVVISNGPAKGSCANFLSLLAQSVEERPEAAVAFSDQDDVWLPQKLSRAMAWLSHYGTETPAIWVCRTVLTNEALEPVGESRLYQRPPSFGNALMQNILAGNTMVMSPAAAKAVARTVPSALRAGVPFHDWWVYQVLTGIGAEVFSETDPLVLYRQHGTNHLGHNSGVGRDRFKRAHMVARRLYADWLTANLTALREHQHMLTAESRLKLRALMRARGQGRQALIAALPRLGLHRQTVKEDRIMRIMALAGLL